MRMLPDVAKGVQLSKVTGSKRAVNEFDKSFPSYFSAVSHETSGMMTTFSSPYTQIVCPWAYRWRCD